MNSDLTRICDGGILALSRLSQLEPSDIEAVSGMMALVELLEKALSWMIGSAVVVKEAEEVLGQ
jgi:hypothetical protein